MQRDTAAVAICRLPLKVERRHHGAMSREDVIVRKSNDWDVPEPWEVVEVTDGAEVVVERTPTEGEAHTKAAEEHGTASPHSPVPPR